MTQDREELLGGCSTAVVSIRSASRSIANCRLAIDPEKIPNPSRRRSTQALPSESTSSRRTMWSHGMPAPNRSNRPRRCSRRFASHGKSTWTTLVAVWRFWPSSPIGPNTSTDPVGASANQRAASGRSCAILFVGGPCPTSAASISAARVSVLAATATRSPASARAVTMRTASRTLGHSAARAVPRRPGPPAVRLPRHRRGTRLFEAGLHGIREAGSPERERGNHWRAPATSIRPRRRVASRPSRAGTRARPSRRRSRRQASPQPVRSAGAMRPSTGKSSARPTPRRVRIILLCKRCASAR